MHTCIALLRGINVVGNNSLPMKELVAILEYCGAREVGTYIQSGNAVFQCEKRNLSQLTRQLAAEIKKRRGFEPYILMLELEDIKKAIKNNPFPDAVDDPSRLFLGFLAAKPQNPDLKKLAGLKKPNERFHLTDRVFYLHAPEGMGKSKVAASAERLMGVPMTIRNWRTVCKVLEKAKDF